MGAAFQLGAKFGVGRCGGIEKTSLISLTSEERRTRPHISRKIGSRVQRPKRLDTAKRLCNRQAEQTGNKMPDNPREMITSAERRFPVRIRISVPPAGLGQRHTQITAWLDENCGADGWAIRRQGPVAC